MKPPVPSDRMLELTIGALTLVFTTMSFLIAAPALGAIALVTGGMSYGIMIARRSGDE
jgi:hypothetical protein